MTSSPSPKLRALALLALPGFLLPLHQVQPAQRAAPYTYTGTVQAVRTTPPSVDLITGVGFALRLIHIRVLAETRLDSAGVTVTFSAIKPGDIVRAECHQADADIVADRVVKLASAGSAPEAKP